jgi:hypothetical protein
MRAACRRFVLQIEPEGSASGEANNAMTDQIPVLQIRHTDGEAWKVAATWPDGRFEEIKGFKSESEANEWIAHSLQEWLDAPRRDAEGDGASAASGRSAER